MEITKTSAGENAATLHLKVSTDDYMGKMENALKKLQRESAFPGFRKGKVPMGHIRRLYGKSILLDEIDKLIQESLEKYITDNNLDILGYPLPNENSKPMDLDNPGDHEFVFDIGLTPEFQLDAEKLGALDYHVIVADDESIDEQIEKFRSTHAEEFEPEVTSPETLLYGTYKELDENGQAVEEGFTHAGFISMRARPADSELVKRLSGLAIGNSVVLKRDELLANEGELAKSLYLETDKLQNIAGDLIYIIEKISNFRSPELNAEFFEKVFPGKGITTNEEFRKQTALAVDNSYIQRVADQYFLNRFLEALMATHEISLPDEFLKKWLIHSSNGSLSSENIDSVYNDKYAKGIRWEIAENQLREKNNLAVTREETRAHIKQELINNYFTFLKNNPEGDDRLEGIVDNVMNNKEEVKKAYDAVAEAKLIELLKNLVHLNRVDITSKEFIKKIEALRKDKQENAETQEEASPEIPE